MDYPEALYIRDGDRYVPTLRSAGPWDPLFQHGGPPSALMAGIAESIESDRPLFASRITVELLRPIPLEPLRASATPLRTGRNVRLDEVRLYADDTEVARASVLRLVCEEVALPKNPDPLPPMPPPSAGDSRSASGMFAGPAFHSIGVEMSWVTSSFDDPGPAQVWIRLRVPVIAGEPTTGFQRAVAAADFSNGVGAWLDPRHVTYINPDLTVNLSRPPDGEWIGLDARKHASTLGVGTATSSLYDERGYIGAGAQSLLLRPAR